jgi:ABC-2 type transport system ATP-binding protein
VAVPVIETIHLTKTYGTTPALHALSFRATPGEILGLLGPNGAGKTTTVRILTGIIPASAGQARVAGFDVATSPLEVKRRIGYVPESGAMYETLTPDEYLDLVAALHHLDRSVARRRVTELFGLFELLQVRRQRLFELSKGTKQKVLVAAALVHNPEVLFLDEPLNGLDANAAAILKELLRGLAAEGRTILFCSHVLDVVERMCTRILVLRAGRWTAEGTAQELMASAGASSLDEAFSRLTGAPPPRQRAADFLDAFDRR